MERKPVKKSNIHFDNDMIKNHIISTLYNEYPVIHHFYNRNGMFPSKIKHYGCYNLKDFLDRIKSIKKTFYTDTISKFHHSLSNHSYQKTFICFEYKKCMFYVTISTDISNKEAKDFTITCLFNPKEDSEKILKWVVDDVIKIPEYKKLKRNKGYLNILVKINNDFRLQQKEIICPEIDFDLNYNPDFRPIHELIIEKLSVDLSKGLVLLHGKAGAGKTTYIRYLISKLKKQIIYIPPNMTNVLSDPELINFFIANSNSILVIEDAENILMKRAYNSTQAIANILNLSDGLLSDCTNIQILCTFNMDILNIDEALLRKGRLIAKYEFKELESEITEKLSKKLGVNIKGKHTLADIYNATDKSFNKKRDKIGFN